MLLEQLLLVFGMLALLAVTFYWSRVVGLATVLQRTGGRLRDGEAGLVEMQLPAGWKATIIPESTATIQVSDRLRRRFVAVISDSRADFTSDFDLVQFHQITLSNVLRAGDILEIAETTASKVAGFEALQSEFVLVLGKRIVTKYLHTAIAGNRAFHQVIAWSGESTYDRSQFQRVLDGFREQPGPRPMSRSVLPPPPAGSNYDVH